MRIIFLFITTFIFAQNEPEQPVHFPTPSSVYEFQRFGDFSANEYKGLANISIPIHEVKVEDVSIPIQANYYTGGIKVNEEAGIIGLGWSMNFPSIVQEVKSYPDFIYNYPYKKLPPFQGNPAQIFEGPYRISQQNNGLYNINVANYVGHSGYQNIPYFSLVHGGVLVDHNGYYNTANKYTNMLNWFNTEPDIFTISLNGVDIKFCIEQSQDESMNSGGNIYPPFKIINGRNEYKVEVIPKQNLQIGESTIEGITIIEPTGNIYTFKAIEIYKTNTSPQGGVFIYKVTKITTRQGKEINFLYDNISSVSETPKLEVNFHKIIGPPQIINYSIPYGSGPGTWFPPDDGQRHYTGSLNSNGPSICFFGSNTSLGYMSAIHSYSNFQQLKEINTYLEKIEFSYSNRIDYHNMNKLDFISVKNKFNQIIRKVNFSYDYFVSPESVNCFSLNASNPSSLPSDMQTKLKNRLKLLAIETEGDNPYLFYYNNILLPKKNSYSYDYWGYYNGFYNTSPYPNLNNFGYSQFTDNSQNNFSSNINFSKACMLEEIVYPTGGSSQFYYESHQFDNLLIQLGSSTPIINIGAGLRIKSITNFDYNLVQIGKTNYEYSEGKCISKRIISNSANSVCYDYTPYNNRVSITSVISFNSNSFLNETADSNGNYIGYSKVTTKKVNTLEEDNGKIEKNFTNFTNSNVITTGNFYVQPLYYTIKNNLLNGLLLKESVFDNQNNLKTEKTINYSNVYFDQNMYGMRKYSAGYRMWVQLNDGHMQYISTPSHMLAFYPIYGKFSRKNRETIKEYFDNESITNITDYNYDSKNNLVEIRSLDSQNFMGTPKQTKSFIYSYNCPWNSALSSLHTAKNIFNLVCRVTENLRGEESSYTDIIYEDIGAVTRKKETSIVSNSIIASSRKIFLDQYDENQNIVQYHLENDIPVSIIWGYHKTLPVAKLENVEYSTISPGLISTIQDESNQNNEQQLKVELSNLRNAHPNAMITTYTHYPLVGLRSITDAKGDTHTYHYLNNRLQFVKDKDGFILSENEYHFINQN